MKAVFLPQKEISTHFIKTLQINTADLKLYLVVITGESLSLKVLFPQIFANCNQVKMYSYFSHRDLKKLTHVTEFNWLLI